MIKSEFNVEGLYNYDRRSAARWVISHVLRYKALLATSLLLSIGSIAAYSLGPVFIGRAAEELLKPGGGLLTQYALLTLTVLI